MQHPWIIRGRAQIATNRLRTIRGAFRMLSGVFFLEAAARQGLFLKKETLKVEDLGMDFKPASAEDIGGQTWILLSPREEESFTKAETERCVLNFVRGRIAARVPEWRVFTRELIAYPCIPGNPALRETPALGGRKQQEWRINPGAPPPAFVDSLAENLLALHSLSIEEGENAGIPFLTPHEFRRALIRRIENCRLFVDIHETWLRRWHAWLADDKGWPAYVAMSHGNLRAEHLLVDHENRVSGILQWARGSFTDPAVDLAMIYQGFGSRVLDGILEIYVAREPRAWPGIRSHVVELASTCPIALAEYGALSGKNRVLEEARSILSRPDPAQAVEKPEAAA